MVDQQPADGVIGQAVFAGVGHKFAVAVLGKPVWGWPIHRVPSCPAARLITEFDGRVPWSRLNTTTVTHRSGRVLVGAEPEIAVVGLRNRSEWCPGEAVLLGPSGSGILG